MNITLWEMIMELSLKHFTRGVHQDPAEPNRNITGECWLLLLCPREQAVSYESLQEEGKGENKTHCIIEQTETAGQCCSESLTHLG